MTRPVDLLVVPLLLAGAVIMLAVDGLDRIAERLGRRPVVSQLRRQQLDAWIDEHEVTP